MTTRTFQAETIMEALQMVQKEMGPDAVVISARDIPLGPAWQVWKKPGVEVISISPEEMQVLKGSSQKEQQPGRIIRPSRNGKGVEFVEEKPSIEWESTPPAEMQKVQSLPMVDQDNLTGSTSRGQWSPRHLSRDEVKENRIFTNPSQAVNPTRQVKQAADHPADPTEALKDAQVAADSCPPALKQIMDKLKFQGIDSLYVDQIQEMVLRGATPSVLGNETRIREFVSKILRASLPSRKWAPTDVPARVVTLVGLSGSGKTNTLAKLAIFYSSLLDKKVAWICADTIRTAAIAEARSYATAAGIPLELAYTPAELKMAVQRHDKADLILVDTPGFNPVSEEQTAELGAFLVEVPEAHNYLVTSASAKEADTLRCFDALKYFGLKGCVISKLDETVSYGSVFNFLKASRLPAMFYAGSRKASSGLKIATPEMLVEALMNGRW